MPSSEQTRTKSALSSAIDDVTHDQRFVLTGPQRSTAAPAYNAATSTHYQNMNVVLNDGNCPYYQLYGPPPSYETVIAQTRGKLVNPASPPLPAGATAATAATTAAESSSSSSATRLDHLQTANVIPNPSVPQCFFYACSSPARLLDGGASQCHRADGNGVPPFAHYSQYCTANGAAVGRGMCVPLEYPGESESRAPSAGDFSHVGYPVSPQHPSGYSIDTPDVRKDAEGHAMLSVDAGGYGASWCLASDQSALRVHGRISQQNTEGRGVTAATGTHVSPSKPEASGSLESDAKRNGVPRRFSRTVNVPEDDATSRRSFPRERTDYGGSLRLPRRNTAGATTVHRNDSFRRIPFRDPSSSAQRRVPDSARTAATESPDAENTRERADTDSRQSNPSNNVILGSFIFESAQSSTRENTGQARDGPRAMNRSTNFDPESKHKLDRSKSLD